MNKSRSIKEQLRRNAVALISLAVAITGLGYNTWRNELSEHNRNQRLVSVEMLVQLGSLYQVLLDIEYGKASDVSGNLRQGWSLARSINDLSMIADGDVPGAGENLLEVWEERSGELRTSDERAKEAIEDAVEEMRGVTHDLLRSLD